MKDETNKTLTDFRAAAKLTQAELASLMGMGLSAYQDLESGFSKFKNRHQMALERASLRLAVEREDVGLALPSIRRDAIDFTRLFNEGPIKRVKVWTFRVFDGAAGEMVRSLHMATAEAIKRAKGEPIGAGAEVLESELDDNGFVRTPT